MLMRLIERVCVAVVVTFVSVTAPGIGCCQTPQRQVSIKRVVAMEYPSLAQVARIQGRVVVAATISTEGAVVGVRVISGEGPLAFAASETLSRWRFGGCEERSKGCEVRVTFSFVLSGTCTVGSKCPTEFVVDLPDAVQVKSGVWDRPIG
jgi:TonB family protein